MNFGGVVSVNSTRQVLIPSPPAPETPAECRSRQTPVTPVDVQTCPEVLVQRYVEAQEESSNFRTLVCIVSKMSLILVPCT